MGNPWSKKSAKMAAAAEDTDSTDDPDSAEDTDSTNDPDSSEENVSTMDEKRIQHKPVALTFADSSNQPTEQDGEGCSYWYPSKRKTYQRHEDRDEDEKALELSRQEMQVTSVTNPTSDIIISDSEIEGDDRVQTNNGVGGGESDKDSSGLEDVGLGIHGEAQSEAQVSGRRDASHENSCLDGAGSSDGEDSDVNDISNEENERDVAAEASDPVADDVDEEGFGDDEDSSAGSSILLQSDEEVDNISSQEITACQPPHASSSCPTQSSKKAITKVGPLGDLTTVTPEGSIEIFDVTEDQDELAQELGVDSQRPDQGYEKTRVKMESPQPSSSPRLKVANNTRTHVTIVVESASGVLPTVPDNGGRHAMSRVDQHKEAAASETVSSGIPTSSTGVLPRNGCHKPKSCNPPEPLEDLSYQKQTLKKKRSHGNRYSLTEALSLTKDYLSQSTWDDGIDDRDHLGLDLPIVTSQAGIDDVFLGMVPGNIEGLHYHTGKVSDHEMVSLVREPLNRYLKNAMKVENAWGDQVGHIKRELAEVLSYILDNNYARIKGVVPSGNKNTHVHSMPVDISLYGPRCNQMTVLQILKGRGHTVSMVESKKSSIYNPRNALGKSVMLSEIEMKNEVDTLFDNLKLTEQEPSKCIVSTMYPHQKQALHWMLARESNDKPATPSALYHNSLTNFTSAKRPDSVRGGILADDMGLGKTLSIISLILHEFAKPECVDVAPSLPSLPEKDEVDCNEPSTSQVKQEVEDDVVLIEDSQEFPIVSEEVIVIDDDSHSSDNDTTIVIKADSPTIPCSSNSTRVTANGRLKRDEAQFEEERLERERRVSALIEEKGDLEAQKQNAAREIDQFAINAVNIAREQNYGLQSKDSELTQAVTAGKRRLENLEGSSKKRLKLYADYMPNLLAEIDRCTAINQFHQKPLGPVGSFLKLKDVRWALGVEACLKRLMYSFRCDDQHDASILKEIMNRLIPQNATQPSIITSKFEANRYDIRSSSVQSNDFPGFLDIVDVSNPVIFNTLVNQRGVETILLIEKLSKEVRNSLRQPPRNCREAFTLEGDQVYAGAVQRYYSSMQRSPKILRGDTDNEIRASAANIKFIFNDDSDDNPSPEKKAKMKLPKMATAPKVKGPSQPVASLPGPCPPINSMVPFKLSSHWFSKPMKAEVSKPMKAEVSKPMKAEVKGHRGHGDAAKPRTTLIVCPLSVMSNWIDQLNEHVADEVQVNVCMYHGAEKKKLTVDYLKQQDVVITTYGTLAAEFKAKQEKGTLQKIEWLRIVLDEAHIIRNRRTLQAQAAIALKAQCKWALTGTPIQNSIKDLWTLVAFLGMEHEPFDPNLNRWQLRKARSIADNDSAGIGRLRKLMNTLALRRMKSQKVNGKPLVDLPARNVVLQYVDFSEDEKKVYQTYEKEGRLAVSKYFREGTVLDHYGEILVIILRLRQLCCHPALCAKAAAKLCQAIDGNERTDEEKAQLVAILVSFLSQGADEECCICLESVQDPVVTRCAHVFCQRCIEEVIISEKERACCPLCRQAISRESLVHVPKDRLDAEKGNTDREWHSSAKVDALMECLLTERAADKTTKSIVVSQFTSFLDVLVKPLTEKGFKFSRLDGSMLRNARTAAISEFSSNDPDSPQIFLLSLKAGGVGLNLTAASRLYLLDPAWNPACEEQSFDRCHRLGQTKDVTITKFLVRESIEEPMLKIQEFKRQLMKQVFGGKNQTPEERRMNRIRDIRILFGMDKTNSRKRERKM
eukprot:XP_003724471.2 PREDICTED: uncharacterized protein LOC100893394 [Strongylocentrotus purpuratus]